MRQLRRLLVLSLFAAGGVAAYQLVVPVLDPGAREAVQAAAAPVREPWPAPPARRPAALRPSVFRLESPAGPLGSASVAWHGGGRTYLLTARFATHAVVADAYSDVLVRRGGQAWRGRVVRHDKLTGFAVLRVESRIGEPLWTKSERPRLRDGDEVVLVLPPQRDTALVRGTIAVGEGVVRMDAPWNPLLLGAPVVTGSGRLAGVVTGVDPRGDVRIAPIGDACQRIRRCSRGSAAGEPVERAGPSHSEWLEWGSREAWRIGLELIRRLERGDASG